MVVDAVPEHWTIVRELVDRHDISASPRILQGTSHAERREPARGAGFEDDGLLRAAFGQVAAQDGVRSEEHTSELQSLMRISYAVFCLKKKKGQSHTI